MEPLTFYEYYYKRGIDHAKSSPKTIKNFLDGFPPFNLEAIDRAKEAFKRGMEEGKKSAQKLDSEKSLDA